MIKMNFKLILVFLLICGGGQTAACQSQLVITYDAAGNRLRQASPCSFDEELQQAEELFQRLELFPNPAQNFTFLSFTAVRAGRLRVEVIEQMGRTKLEVYDLFIEPGEFRFRINSDSFSPGVYFVKLLQVGDPTYLPFVVY